ncbi:2-oxoglutarate (2OG) and Fe(II)-dependent oxygenase superfamily protein [Melia azedarach]|uniref:2-oxoglutarate (2OG) and Fe(II)-dependent oxygenase superfamily protein n=1 Tax=Melia azedarach TaxID=155640 RepID=A0ACC1XQR1_MELAZ|nr:2-oxoglutarate (2OG) and Fe(II)-dependent oxygenase superfamily protein [Melia azedarach]
MADHLNADDTKAEVRNLHCIDLSDPDIKQSAALIKQACSENGMFYVINHGISNEVMDEAFAKSKKFFEIPESERMKLLFNDNQRGYQPPVRMSYYYIETYTIGVRAHGHDPTNIWPPTDVLPGWKEAMERYKRDAFNVGKVVARLVALALGLDIDYFNQPKMLGETTACLCSVLHYGDPGNDSSMLDIGAVGHTDVGLFTLVATDGISGLDVCRDSDAKPQAWDYVLPNKRALIVNVGNLLQRLSNDTFRCMSHKAGYRGDGCSIEVFLVPCDDCVIEPLPVPKIEA